MAATGTPTPNIGLRVPIGTDPASVDDINYNSNLLDTKLGPVGSDSVQDQIDTLNSKFAYKELTKTINAGFTEYTLVAGDYPDGFTSANSMIVSVTCKAYNALNNGQQEYAWINGTNIIQYYLSGSNSRQITLQVLFMKN